MNSLILVLDIKEDGEIIIAFFFSCAQLKEEGQSLF